MSIFNLFSKREKEKVVIGHTETEIANIYDYLNFPTIKFDDSLALNISTVYTACKILADDVGSFPINVYKTGTFNEESIDKDDPLYELLHYNPNPYTSSNVFLVHLSI
jgi:Phage-related protein